MHGNCFAPKQYKSHGAEHQKFTVLPHLPAPLFPPRNIKAVNMEESRGFTKSRRTSGAGRREKRKIKLSHVEAKEERKSKEGQFGANLFWEIRSLPRTLFHSSARTAPLDSGKRCRRSSIGSPRPSRCTGRLLCVCCLPAASLVLMLHFFFCISLIATYGLFIGEKKMRRC